MRRTAEQVVTATSGGVCKYFQSIRQFARAKKHVLVQSPITDYAGAREHVDTNFP
jgi:hypothetical protein